MTITFVSYDSLGKLAAWGRAPEHTLQNHEREGRTVLVVEIDPDLPWGETHMVVEGQLVPRPVLAFDKTTIAADDEDKATLTGLPDPCTVLVDGEPYEITGGTLQIKSPMPATYEIEIENPFPAQPFKATIHAVDPD